MIRTRYYCGECRLRQEAEIVYDKRLGKSVYAYTLKSKSPFIPKPIDAHDPPVCPNCGKTMERSKLVKDVPDRYIDENGNLRIREYKDI